MENNNPSFNFTLAYAGQDVNCQVTMAEKHYDVSFDGKFIGSIALDDEMEWLQESGTILPQSMIDDIGRKVESKYM